MTRRISEKMRVAKRPGFSTGAAIAVAIVIVILAIFIKSASMPKQTPEDCVDGAEKFESSSSRCRMISGAEYAQNMASIDEANIANGEKDGTYCVSATRAREFSEGEYCCIEFVVNHIYGMGSTAFMDSTRDTIGDFSVVSFRNEGFTYGDAEALLGARLEARGAMHYYEGEPEIIIRDFSQLSYPSGGYYGDKSADELFLERSRCFEDGSKDIETENEKLNLVRNCSQLGTLGD